MVTFYCQNVWNYSPSSYRNKLIYSLVNESNADVCAFQEVGPTTIRSGDASLPQLLEREYAEICPEFSNCNFTPIYYKRNKFDVLDSGYFLYDGLNDANSKSVTWTVLKQKESIIKFAVISTHFWWKFESETDNKQRLKNVEQLYEACEFIISKHNVPIIIGGDLNNGKNSLQGEGAYEYLKVKGFRDIRMIADETSQEHTHHEYPVLNKDGIYEKGTLPDKTLDHIFIYGNSSIEAKKFEVITNQKALDSSDHCPLIAWFEF